MQPLSSLWAAGKRKELVWAAALALLFGGLLCWWAPLKEAFEFGGDEGDELIKGLMCGRGFRLYTEVWNYQPPLHTLLLGLLFKACGPTLLGARVLTVCFAAVLVGTQFLMASRKTTPATGILASAFLVVSPYFLLLSVSVMLEMPAIASAWVASCIAMSWPKYGGRRFLFLSGLAMGLALQIKLTAAIVIPALVVEIALSSIDTCGRWAFASAARAVLLWVAGVCLTFFAVFFLCGEHFAFLWSAHFLPVTHPEFGIPTNYRLDWQAFQPHLEAVLGVGAGVLAAVLAGQLRAVCLPLVLLVTATGLHLFHCPYWNYYYLHLLVPMAWLSGYGVSGLWGLAARELKRQSPVGRLSAFAAGSAALLLMFLLLILGGRRLAEDLSYIAQRPRVQDDALVNAALQNAPRTRWMFSERQIYSFHARCSEPPELAVLHSKRMWSGGITGEELIACLKHYRPEQMVLPSDVDGYALWKPLLEADYRPECRYGGKILFVRKDLAAGGSK